MERKVLILGAGESKLLQVPTPLRHLPPTITTLDIEASHKPDVVWDLNSCPWPFKDNSFTEIHAYEVLEHFGRQGDYRAFFAHFWEIYRILEPMGYLAGSVPLWNEMWAWGDPSHCRVINEGTFSYLDQALYKSGVGKTCMTDFRSIWKGDIESLLEFRAGRIFFMCKVHKPARA